MLRLAVLASGNGSNLQSILDAAGSGDLGPAVPTLVVADRPCGALDRADDAGIPSVLLERHLLDDGLSRELGRLLDSRGIDLVALAGWLSILDGRLTEDWTGRMINIHPALLPLHGGPGMYGQKVHQAVLDSGDTVSGCTVHFVTEDVDGGEILGQERVDVRADDTAETLAARVLAREHALYPRIISKIAAALAAKSVKR